MPNLAMMPYYMNNFLYAESRPHLAEMVASSISMEQLKCADVSTKLMSIGAQLVTGKYEECVQLVDELSFDDIRSADRSFLALIIFNTYYERSRSDRNLANALKHFLVAMSPVELLAHKQFEVDFPRGNLIELDYAHSLSTSVSGTVFFREYVFNSDSRKCECGPRLRKALVSQGWDVSFLLNKDVHSYSSATRSDFAIIDVWAFYMMPIDAICDTLSRLKRYFRKIIMLDIDGWAGTFDDMLNSLHDHIDYVWVYCTGSALSKDAGFGKRCIQFPGFGGLEYLDNIDVAGLDWSTCAFNFTGSVQGYSLNRIYWILESIIQNQPIQINMTHPVDDGLDPIHSQQLYAQVLSATHSSINLVTRRDGSRPYTGRAFEVISLNRLLVQENCPEFHRYFVDGEHFLEFSTFEELSATIEFLRLRPNIARKICSQGYQFYKERYSCKKLAEHLQMLL